MCTALLYILHVLLLCESAYGAAVRNNAAYYIYTPYVPHMYNCIGMRAQQQFRIYEYESVYYIYMARIISVERREKKKKLPTPVIIVGIIVTAVGGRSGSSECGAFRVHYERTE